MRPMRRAPISLAVSFALLLALNIGGASAGDGGQGQARVKAVGRCSVQVNNQIQCTYRFTPEFQNVLTGQKVNFIDQTNREPHTATFANQKDLPTDVIGIFSCGSDPNDPCGYAFRCHFGQGLDYKCEDDQDGEFGLDAPGDSYFFTQDKTTVTTVTATPGTTLYYLCAFHAWMQGKVVVQ
jgi:plastocyanin